MVQLLQFDMDQQCLLRPINLNTYDEYGIWSDLVIDQSLTLCTLRENFNPSRKHAYIILTPLYPTFI